MTREELNALPIGAKVKIRQYDELLKDSSDYKDNGIYLPYRDGDKLLFNDRMKFFCGKEGEIKTNTCNDGVQLSFKFPIPKENQHWAGGWNFCASMLEPVSSPPPPQFPLKPIQTLWREVIR